MLLASLLAFVAGLCLQPITETDLFFRLKVGQEILARRQLLDRNLFSFTAPDHPDLDLAWLFEIGVALLYQVGGFPAVVIGKTIAIGVVFAGAFAVCRWRGAGAVATTLTLAGAAVVMRERLVERPHVVSFAGEVVVLAAIVGIRRRWSRTVVLAFAFAMLLWANAHAGVFTGVLMLVLAGAGALRTDPGLSLRAWLLGALVAIAACATPVGPVGMVRYLALHLSLPSLHPIDEFRNATWRSDGPFLLWLAGVAAIVLFHAFHRGGSVTQARPATAPAPHAPAGAVSDVLPAAGIVILGIASVRFSADAVLVTAPLVATRLSSVPGLLGTAGRVSLARFGSPVVAAMLLTAAVGPRLAEARAGRTFLDLRVAESAIPLDAIRFVEDNGLRERMYNDFEIGSYLLFQGYPRYRVFIDPRLPAYPEDMHRLLGSFDVDRASWDDAMTKYGVDSALLAYAGINRRVAWWEPSRWALVYRASNARVFVRRRDEWRALIAAHEIPATFDFDVEHGTTTLPLEPKPVSSPVPECEWQRRLGDLCFELDRGNTTRARRYYERALAAHYCLVPREEAALSAWMGALELQESHWSRAVEHLDRALSLSPEDTQTRANRAIALEGAGRRVEAAADWIRLASQAHGTPLGVAAAARSRLLDR
jgi:tetratricopeptide (TPR) repeat protein